MGQKESSSPDVKESMNTTIILIGPLSTGKSTIASLLAQTLNLPRCELDKVRWNYYREIGYDDAAASDMARSEHGLMRLLHYSKPFEAHTVERVLADHHGVIDFGASHSVYEDEQLFTRVQKALAPFPYVILLLPSPDLDESVTIVNARFAMKVNKDVSEVGDDVLLLNEQFVKHPSNHLLAKRVIYTKDKTPQETCAEIVANLGLSGEDV